MMLFRFISPRRRWLGHVLAALLLLTVAACDIGGLSDIEKQTANFKALVMGGRELDPNHTWNTAAITPITINMALGNSDEYTVYLFLALPSVDANAAYVGMAKVRGNQSRTINVALPADAGQVYAACMDRMDNVNYLPIYDNAVTFSSRNIVIPASTPSNNCMFYAFEIPGEGTAKDFDFNDVVLRVSAPYDNGDGTFSVGINVAAIGTKVETYVLLNGEVLGEELHEVMGIATSSTVNINAFTSPSRRLGELTMSEGELDITRLSFSLQQITNAGKKPTTTLIEQPDDIATEAPLYIVVNGDQDGKWHWPKEGSNIGLAYPQFSSWASDQQSSTSWYTRENASSSRIISW